MSDYNYSSNDKYSVLQIKLEGLEQLGNNDKIYIKRTLRKGDHVYVRFNYENGKYEVMRHDNIIGYLPESVIGDREDFFDKLGYAEVSNKSISLFNKRIEVCLYLKDENGVLPLPFPSVNERKVSVIETDLWKGDWNSDWSLIPITDELVYRFPELYGSDKLLNDIETDVDLHFNYFIGEFLSGNLRTEYDVEQKIMNSAAFEVIIENNHKRDIAKRILWHRIKSYMSHKGYAFLTPNTEDNNGSHNVDNSYEPHFHLDYRKEDGSHVTKTVNHSNMNVSVMGMKYRDNYRQLLDKVQKGVELTIKPDPNNEYDDTALGFYLDDGELVGYVSRKDKPFVELFMKQGQLRAVVTYSEDDNVDTNIQLTKSDVNESVISKYNLRVDKVDKKKGDGSYIESLGAASIEELKNYLE